MGVLDGCSVALFTGGDVTEFRSDSVAIVCVLLTLLPVTRLLKPGGTGGSAAWPRWRRLQRVASSWLGIEV
jgi:hypothetical protein